MKDLKSYILIKHFFSSSETNFIINEEFYVSAILLINGMIIINLTV